jgi:hypothetical protein
MTTFKDTRMADRARAVVLIRQYAPQGHSVGWIADKLTELGIPTLCGRPGAAWNRGRVWDLSQKYDIKPWSKGKQRAVAA